MPITRAESRRQAMARDTQAVRPAGIEEEEEVDEKPGRRSIEWIYGARAGVAVVLLQTLLYLSAPPPVEAYNICTCQCCYSGICIDRPNSEEWNGTFQVPGCSFCTKSLCFEHIKKPIGSCDEVSATCVDYDTYWRLTVILLILFLLASLLIIGCLRDVPVVKRWFKLA